MLQSVIRNVIFAVSALCMFQGVAQACVAPPHDTITHHADLVRDSENILLARAVSSLSGVYEDFEALDLGFEFETFNSRVKFETLEVLKGEAEESLILSNGRIRDTSGGLPHPYIDDHVSSDFNGHRHLLFWDWGYTRSTNSVDCRIYPEFEKGKTYLLFPDFPHRRGYEEIVSEDDLWLSAVRRLIADPTLKSGLSMTIQEWFSMTEGAFVGVVKDCDGRAFAVDHVFHGEFEKTWHRPESDSQMNADPTSWWCFKGMKFLVTKYLQNSNQHTIFDPKFSFVLDDKVSLFFSLKYSEIDFVNGYILNLE